MPSNDASNFFRLLDRSMAVMTSFFSSFMLTFIIGGPTRLELTVIVFVLLLMWFLADRLLRNWLQRTPMLKENQRWRAVINEVLDFFLMFGLFLSTQLLLSGLRSTLNTSEMSGVEVVVFVLSLILGGFAFVNTAKNIA